MAGEYGLILCRKNKKQKTCVFEREKQTQRGRQGREGENTDNKLQRQTEDRS